jgi:cytidine deaminase
MMTLTPQDHALVERARAVIRDRYREGWHCVGAALRTQHGLVFTGVHLEANVGRIAVCAEAVALGRAATEAGDTQIAER